MSDFFVPLGGGNEVGASAYYLSIDGMNILLDCGARLRGEELYPDYERLLREMTDFSEINLIVISHGHYDHIGSFAKIAALACNAEIVMTKDTKSLIEMQLLDFGRISGRVESERIKNERYRLAQALMARIQIKPVLKSFVIKGCEITLMPAGHMLGAVMIYIKSKNHNILYSGDFSVRTKFGINGLRVTPDINPSVLLLNAPNAYFDSSEWDSQRISTAVSKTENDNYQKLESYINRKLKDKKSIYIYSRSIPRHLDLFYFLKNSFSEVPVIMEPKSRKIADSLSDMGYQIYSSNILSTEKIPEQGCIIVGQELSRSGCIAISFDSYSLHASIDETIELVENIGARQVFLLHVRPDNRKNSLKKILKDRNEVISVIQAENGMKYYLERVNNMIHEQIYQEIMQKELIRADDQLKNNSKTKAVFEWAAIYGSLVYPDQHPKIAYQHVNKAFAGEYQISYDEYLDALRNVNLDNEDKRKYVISLVSQGMTLLKAALDGDKLAIERYSEFTEDLEPRDRKNRKMFFVGKCMVVFMILVDPDFKDDQYKPIAFSFGARYCDRLLRNIRDGLLKEYGMSRRKKSARDVLQKTEKALFESTEAVASFATGNELEQLRFMNNNYRNSLELVQAMLDELNETIDETAADAKKAAIASFYSTMNSEDYGNLLDSLELVDRRLATIKEQKIKVPPQLLPLTIVFKQLLRFIKDCGISQIDTTGREFITEVEGLAEYTYIGDAYLKEGEKKTVVVERPGWKFEDTVISLPTVREKEE